MANSGEAQNTTLLKLNLHATFARDSRALKINFSQSASVDALNSK